MPIMIQISELGLSDEDRHPIFQDLHFRLNRGDWAAISGPASSGKSLLLKLLCGECRPDRGQILVDERNILRISSEKKRLLKRRLGMMVEPDHDFKKRSLSNYIQFKLRALDVPVDELAQKSERALDLVGLEEKANQIPQELNAVELRLFSLALALSHEPVLLLLDQPLKGLEKEKQRLRFLEVLEQIHLRRRLTTLMTLTNERLPDKLPLQQYDLTAGRILGRDLPELKMADQPSEVIYE